MGKLIEESRTTTPMSNEEIVDTLKTMVFGAQAFKRFNAKERETLDKAWNIIDQYETRIKANMVAMLTELQLDIQEVNTAPQFLTDDNVKDFRECVDTIIQQKIDKLRGEESG